MDSCSSTSRILRWNSYFDKFQVTNVLDTTAHTCTMIGIRYTLMIGYDEKRHDDTAISIVLRHEFWDEAAILISFK